MSNVFEMVAKMREGDKAAMTITPECAQVALEIREERAAICEYDGLMPRAWAEQQGMLESESWREACEIRHVLTAMNIEQRRDYFAKVEKARGLAAANKLRDGVRDAWTANRAASKVAA